MFITNFACLQETQGVTVASYGPTRDFPSFFTPRSGFQAPYNVETPAEAANLIGKQRVFTIINLGIICFSGSRTDSVVIFFVTLVESCLSMELGSGVLIAVPIPKQFAGEGEVIEYAIQRALSKAK